MVNMCLCLHTVKLAGSLVKANRQLLSVVVRGTLRECVQQIQYEFVGGLDCVHSDAQ